MMNGGNPANEFLSEHCRVEKNQVIRVEDAYGAYSHWAKANGYVPLNPAQFGKQVHKKYPQLPKKRGSSGKQRPWVYDGLAVDDRLHSYTVPIFAEAA
jgi:phage/plasmid-associated DNA primase